MIVVGIEVNTSRNICIKNTLQLSKVSIEKTKNNINENTTHTKQIEFYYGYISFINDIIDKIINEKRYKSSLVLTNGLAIFFNDLIKKKFYYESQLTLQRLYLIGLKKYARI